MSEIHIGYPTIQEIAAKGVRRTAVFMGLGLNAALDPNFKAYKLTQIMSPRHKTIPTTRHNKHMHRSRASESRITPSVLCARPGDVMRWAPGD